MTQALVAQDQTTEVVPINPADAKAWELVNSVLTWMGDNACYCYSEAFRQLGVSRASFYRAIKQPFVQGRIAERMDALDSAVAKMLDDHWTAVMANMVQIAQGKGREAVQAARFLAQQKERIQEEKRSVQRPEGPSQAQLLIDKFTGGTGKMILVEHKRTRKVEIEPENENGTVVEG